MKVLGMLLFAGGFLIGSFFLVSQLATINWLAFAISTAICTLGVILMRIAARTDQSAQRSADVKVQVIGESLQALVDKIGDINERREQIGVYGIHAELDRLLIDDLNAFVGAREAMIYKYGLDHYARVMDAFAAAERALNRAWSASADGYIDEVWASLDRAHRAIVRAQQAARTPGSTQTAPHTG